MLKPANVDKIVLIDTKYIRNKDAVIVTFDKDTKSYSFDVFTDDRNDIDQDSIKTYKKYNFLCQDVKKNFKIYDAYRGEIYNFEPGSKYYFNWEEYSGPKEILYLILKSRFCD